MQNKMIPSLLVLSIALSGAGHIATPQTQRLYAAENNAKNTERRLVFSPEISDYSPQITEALNQLLKEGGGTLVIPYGKYPMRAQSLITAGEENVTIAIRGEKNAKGESPLLFDTDSSKDPHTFLIFLCDKQKVCGLSVNISNLEIQGNNVPLDLSKATVPFSLDEGQTDTEPNPDLPRDQTYGHPFFYRKDTGYSNGIMIMDLKTVHIDNVTVKDIFGNGLFLASYAQPEFISLKPLHKNMHPPSVTNCKVLNTWQWHNPDNSGDGIMMWDIETPLIENNIIANDISYTRWPGRCGIVLENHTIGATIRNNTVSGYARNIHIENTFGAHKVIGNRLLASDIGIALNEPDPLHPAETLQYIKPDLIQGNHFQYDQERERYGAHPFGGEKGFIDVTVYRSAALNGTRIVGNKFIYNLHKGVKINRWREYDVKHKTPRIYTRNHTEIKDWIETGNTYK